MRVRIAIPIRVVRTNAAIRTRVGNAVRTDYSQGLTDP